MILLRTAVGAAMIAVPLALATPALATPNRPSIDCQTGCDNRSTIAADTPAGPLLGAPWNQIWPGDAKGPWENAFAGDIWGNGVNAINGGAWEKVFGEAP